MCTQMRASRLPSTSIALAAFSTIRRMASISMRAREMISMLPPSLTSCLPKASRDRPRLTIRSSAFSAWPMERMQWWMRPGPEAHLADLEAAAFAQQHVLLGHAHVVEDDVHVAVRRVVFAEHVHRRRGSSRPGVSLGTRICDCCLCGGASGLVRTMVIMILQRGSPAPEM